MGIFTALCLSVGIGPVGYGRRNFGNGHSHNAEGTFDGVVLYLKCLRVIESFHHFLLQLAVLESKLAALPICHRGVCCKYLY